MGNANEHAALSNAHAIKGHKYRSAKVPLQREA
jgi:hypothetical protein